MLLRHSSFYLSTRTEDWICLLQLQSQTQGDPKNTPPDLMYKYTYLQVGVK